MCIKFCTQSKQIIRLLTGQMLLFQGRMQTGGQQIIIRNSCKPHNLISAEIDKDQSKKSECKKPQGQSTKMKVRKNLVPRPAKVAWERGYNTTVSPLQLPRPFGQCVCHCDLLLQQQGSLRSVSDSTHNLVFQQVSRPPCSTCSSLGRRREWLSCFVRHGFLPLPAEIHGQQWLQSAPAGRRGVCTTVRMACQGLRGTR